MKYKNVIIKNKPILP